MVYLLIIYLEAANCLIFHSTKSNNFVISNCKQYRNCRISSSSINGGAKNQFRMSQSPDHLITNPSDKSFLQTLWKFTRPHTMIGSGISILSIYLYAYPYSLWKSVSMWKSIIFAAVPSLFMNIYITGLNQLTDIEIDKVNKPYLPLPAGLLSKQAAYVIVIASLFLSFFTSISASWPLQLTLWSSFILGTIYSFPGIRLKRFPFLAALCIIVVRGAVVNLGFYVSIYFMSSYMLRNFKPLTVYTV